MPLESEKKKAAAPSVENSPQTPLPETLFQSNALKRRAYGSFTVLLVIGMSLLVDATIKWP